MSTLQAIPTVYSDHQFRSRLEARWAVFFDALGVRWNYEAEGYDLPSGRYLPDFWLPDHKLHFEVKPRTSPEAFDKCCDLAMLTGYPVVMSLGQPAHPVESGRLLETDGQMGVKVFDETDGEWWVQWDTAAWHEVFDEHWPHASRFWPLPVGLGPGIELDEPACLIVCGVEVEAALVSDRVAAAVGVSRSHSFWGPK